MKIKMNKSVMNIIIIVCAAIVLFVVLKYLNNSGSQYTKCSIKSK